MKSPNGTQSSKPFQLVVTIDSRAGATSLFRGWGTSLCWWANALGRVRGESREYERPGPEEPDDCGLPFMTGECRSALADALFAAPPLGLGLTVLRYNIGGGDDPACAHGRLSDSVAGRGRLTHFRFGGDVPGWQPGPDEPIADVDVDAGQIWFLCAARDRGADTFEAFANSPPWWMTVSGCTGGAAGKQAANNLSPKYIDAFAEYLVGVLARIRDAHGIAFQTLNPINEPSTEACKWLAGNIQEGCNYDVHLQNKVILAAHKAIARHGLTTEISIGDEVSPATQISSWVALTPAARRCVAQINSHTYGDTDRSLLRRIAQQSGKRLWMSEICHGGNAGRHDHDAMSAPLQLAQAIALDLKHIRPECWVYWQAIEDENNARNNSGNWGFIHADMSTDGKLSLTEPCDGFGPYTNKTLATHWSLTKKYWAFAQFCHFIRPGAIVLDVIEDHSASNVFTVAAFQPVSVVASSVTAETPFVPLPSYCESTHDQVGSISGVVSSISIASTSSPIVIQQQQQCGDSAMYVPPVTVSQVPMQTIESTTSRPQSGYEMVSWETSDDKPQSTTCEKSQMGINAGSKSTDPVDAAINASTAPSQSLSGSLIVVLVNKSQHDTDVVIDYGKHNLVPQDVLDLSVYRTSSIENLKSIMQPQNTRVSTLIPLLNRPQPISVRLTPESITTLVLRGLALPMNAPWQRPCTPNPLSLCVYRIESVFSGRCLTAPSMDMLIQGPNGSNILTQCKYRPGDLTQHWVLTETTASTPEDPVFTIESLATTRLLDVNRCDRHNGTSVITWPRGGGPNQAWRIQQCVGLGTGIMRIASVMHGKVMDVSGWDMGEGAHVIMWDAHGGVNQQWKLVPIIDSE